MFEYVGYICALLAICSSLIGLKYALSLRSHVKNWSCKKPERYPSLSVISPQRGKIHSRNIDALLGQDYTGEWEVIFVTTQDDASLHQLRKYSTEHKNVRIVMAEDVVDLARKEGIHRCQKNNNLVTAIENCSPKTEVYVIADADACPFSNWLSNLIAPLTAANSQIAAVTSARVYIPGKGLASWAQSAWVLFSLPFLTGNLRLLWAGGMAIPKAIFEKANLMSQINGQGVNGITSDDMSIYKSLRQQGYKTLFVPDCIVPRYPPDIKEKWLDVIRFTNRQALHCWWTYRKVSLFLLFLAVSRFPMFLCALAVAWWYPLSLVALLSLLIDAAYGAITKHTLLKLATQRIKIKFSFWIVFFPILLPLLSTINSVSAPFYRKLRWSGIEYTHDKVLGYTGDFSWRAK